MERIVHVIAPSSKGKQANVKTYREFVRNTVGMTAHITDSIFRDGADPFYANTDQFRADDLVDALTDDSAVVWCALGGKGASRLIPYLEALPEDRKRKIQEAKKVLVGYSDITALHVYLQTVYGWQTIHGTMLELIADGMVDQRSVDALVALVTGRSARVEYELRLVDVGDRASPSQPLRSKVVGGNLTLVENTAGTAYQLRGAGNIVFLEDVNVRPYALERSLDHLKQTGMFEGTVAVVFGSFVSDADPSDLMGLVFCRFAAFVPFPVFRVDDIGHGFVNNPLPLNTNATVVCRAAGDGSVSYVFTVDNVSVNNDNRNHVDGTTKS